MEFQLLKSKKIKNSKNSSKKEMEHQCTSKPTTMFPLYSVLYRSGMLHRRSKKEYERKQRKYSFNASIVFFYL